jgi:hypothetical protein
MYQLFVENQEVDIDEKIGIQLSYAIDDIARFANRDTSFSKQIVLKGTNRTNNALGLIFELGNANPYVIGQRNIGKNFNVAQTARAELRLYGLQVLKGVFRLIGIQRTRDIIEYEGVLFGELGGLIAAISNKKIEELDFGAYDHVFNTTNITASWDAVQGSGYFYPLIDYGTYSSNKVDYDIRTLRPAFYVKEYLDKIFEDAAYEYECDFFDTARFKSFIIPNNTKELKSAGQRLLEAEDTDVAITIPAGSKFYLDYDNIINNSFIQINSSTFEFDSPVSIPAKIRVSITASGSGIPNVSINVEKNGLRLNGIIVGFASASTFETQTTLVDGDVIRIYYQNQDPFNARSFNISANTLNIISTTDIQVPVSVGDTIRVNDTIPKGIFQRDFLASILKMFNLYVVEDRIEEKRLIIKPYIDFYSGENVDWTYQVARDKTWNIMPMGNLNGRIFEYKYKEDSDFYNDEYRKKYNITYGSRQFDTGFQFSKDRQTTDVIFAGSPLIKYSGTDKTLTAIYKKSKGNSVDQEELTESVLRILTCKKITGVTSWKIKNGVSDLATITNYGYAGHLDDPTTPTFDLNFGAPNEIYCDPDQYTSNNLFNVYWSSYIAEIADKDSKLLKCHVYLRPIDIAKLNFSKDVFIDGVRFRINKIDDYDGLNNELTRVELLKVING